MSYSRYFGMRSFENVVRDGRFRAPKTGTPFKIGAPVEIDAANAGFMKAADAAAVPGQNCGLAVYEHIQLDATTGPLVTTYDSPYDQVPLGQYTQMMHGPGTKVWFKNQGDKVLYDGRTQTGGSLLSNATSTVAGTGDMDLTTLAPGDGLVPDGAGKFRKVDAAATTAETAWLIVEQVNPTTGLVEARLTF